MLADVVLWVLGLVLIGIALYSGWQLRQDMKRDLERHEREYAQLKKDMGWD